MNMSHDMTGESRSCEADSEAEVLNAFQRYSRLFKGFQGVILKKLRGGGRVASKLFLRPGQGGSQENLCGFARLDNWRSCVTVVRRLNL